MKQTSPTEQLDKPADSPCPALPEAFDVEQRRLNQAEAAALAKQCNQLGRNNREVSGRPILLTLGLFFVVGSGVMISVGFDRINAFRNGTADLLPILRWCTSFAVPFVSILMLAAIVFFMRVTFADVDPPFGSTTKIHLDQHWYEVEWKAESGRTASLTTLWSHTQLRWSKNAWLIRSAQHWSQFLIQPESFSSDQQKQFQQFAFELTDWQRAHPNHAQHDNIFPPIEERGIAYEFGPEHQPELDHLKPDLEALGFIQPTFIGKHFWLIWLWLAIVCISAFAFPMYSALILKQGFGLSWMFSIIPIWLLYQMCRSPKQEVAPDFHIEGLITPSGVWTQTPQARLHQSFSGLTDCWRLDHALLLSWGKANNYCVILKSSFAQETDWHAACRQIESATPVRSV